MVLPEELMNAETVDAGLAQITEYLDAGGDVDDVNADGETLLYSNIAYAAGDDLRIVKYLIANGANVDKRRVCTGGGESEDTPLYQACNRQDQAVGLGAIRCLLEAGANINLKRKVNGPPIVAESPLSTAMDWLRYDDVGWGALGLAYVALLLRYAPNLDDCWGDRSAEDCLRHIEEPDAFTEELATAYSEAHPPVATKEQFLACKKLIADERCRISVAKRKDILRLRSLSTRGRAKTSDAALASSFRLPEGVLWNVLRFWPPKRPKTFWRATTYAGSRAGCAFTTRDGRTGYWVDEEPYPADVFGVVAAYRSLPVSTSPLSLGAFAAPGHRYWNRQWRGGQLRAPAEARAAAATAALAQWRSNVKDRLESLEGVSDVMDFDEEN